MSRVFPLLFTFAALALAADDARVSTLMVAMRDGVKLSTTVYAPSDPGKYPVLVARTPYGKGGERRTAEFFAANGYVFVAQDVRGRGDSEGHLYPLRDEGPDGYDTIQWAAAQPWSNGKVGTIGASYLGMDQYGAALLKPPALAAMYVAVAGFSYYRDAAYRGGARSTGWPVWLLFSASTSRKADADPELKQRLTAVVNKPDEWLSLPPAQRELLFEGFPDQLLVYRDFYAHPLFDDYWKQPGLNPGGYLDKIKDVPIMMVGGWYDSFTDSMLDGFQSLRKLQQSEKRIVVGPWPHPYGKAVCGQATFGPEAELDERHLQLEWFDHWLKGAASRTGGGAPIRYYRMGGNGAQVQDAAHINPAGEWLTAEKWPPAGTVTRRLFLEKAGRLSDHAAGKDEPITYESDPAHPTATLGGRQGPTCIVNQGAKRSGVVSFTGAPLEKAVNATGPVRVGLSISSDQPDTDFTARLIDVYPDGYAMNLAEGQVRASYRKGDESLAQPLKPRRVYQLTIELGSTSNLFAKGHRIQVDVSSSSFPRLEPNPQTGEPGMWSRRVSARNALHNGSAHPSYIVLTVLPD